MSTVEIKASIDSMSEEERFFAKAYLHHLNRDDDVEYWLALDKRVERNRSGHGVTLETFERLHYALEAEGR